MLLFRRSVVLPTCAVLTVIKTTVSLRAVRNRVSKTFLWPSKQRPSTGMIGQDDEGGPKATTRSVIRTI